MLILLFMDREAIDFYLLTVLVNVIVFPSRVWGVPILFSEDNPANRSKTFIVFTCYICVTIVISMLSNSTWVPDFI